MIPIRHVAFALLGVYWPAMPEQKKVVIVGGGLGGICAGIHLSRAGIDDFVILDRAGDPGGTWRDNTYPGCACDVPVGLYQFSFAPSIRWRHVFPRAAEMQGYVGELMDNFALAPRFRGGDGAQSARWDSDRNRWRIRTERGNEFEADAMVAALGQLNRPRSRRSQASATSPVLRFIRRAGIIPFRLRESAWASSDA